MLLPHRLKIRRRLAGKHLPLAQSHPRPPHRAVSRPQVVRSRLQPVVGRVSRPQVVLSRLQPVVGRVSRPPVVQSRLHPLVLVLPHPRHRVVSRLLLALPHHPPRSLKVFANPVIFDEMAGVLRSALCWLGSQLKAMEASVYFYRDTDQQEVGLLVESGDTLYPVGIKKTVSPWQNARRQFDVLDKLGIGLGAVLRLVERDLPLPQSVKAVPVG